MKRILTLTLVVAALATLAGNALAFRMIQNTGVGRFSAGAAVACNNSGGFTHWNTCNISWRLNTANQGAGKTTAVQNAMASWTNVGSACHVLSYAGTSNAGFVTDGINVLRWATGEGCSGSCLALTALVLQSGQRIVETDVTFNNAVTWTTNGNNYDTEAVAAHELGHTLGLHHTNVAGSGTSTRPTMYAIYFGSAGRSLQSDDQQGLQCSQSRYNPVAAQFAAEPVATETPAATAGRAALALSSRPRAGGALVRFTLPAGADVKLDVYDVAGRHVANLVNAYQGAGDHEVAWDGGHAASGVYFARLVSASGTARATVLLSE